VTALDLRRPDPSQDRFSDITALAAIGQKLVDGGLQAPVELTNASNEENSLQLTRIASGLSGAPRIAQGGKPSQRVTAIDPVMHQEAFDEGVHLVLRERRSETLKRGLRSVP
jgi:hypothetical protein